MRGSQRAEKASPDEAALVLFTVPGDPQPQGSARAFTYRRKPEKGGGIGARVDSDNPKLKAWRQHAAWCARQVFTGVPYGGPIRIVANFYLRRPKALPGETPHVTRPDVDKLTRALADALTGVLYGDDGQITHVSVSKQYARPGESARAVVSVMPLGDPRPRMF